MIPSPDLPTELARLGLKATAQNLDDFLARATQKRWSPLQQLEEIVRAESEARAQRGLQTRLRQARLGRFRPWADFDWN
ncbi:MAG: ATP-binding protein, partial [Terriglobales bacterium]